MNDIRFVATAPGRGKLYINGVEVPGVINVEPNLLSQDSLATVTVELSVKSFALEQADPR